MITKDSHFVERKHRLIGCGISTIMELAAAELDRGPDE
jgi:hypothetical protein